jgi:hypothetical protein
MPLPVRVADFTLHVAMMLQLYSVPVFMRLS